MGVCITSGVSLYVDCRRVSSCSSRVPGYACSEATVEQIVDGFHEQEVRTSSPIHVV